MSQRASCVLLDRLQRALLLLLKGFVSQMAWLSSAGFHMLSPDCKYLGFVSSQHKFCHNLALFVNTRPDDRSRQQPADVVRVCNPHPPLLLPKLFSCSDHTKDDCSEGTGIHLPRHSIPDNGAGCVSVADCGETTVEAVPGALCASFNFWAL